MSKVFDVKVEGGNIKATLDPNKDGQSVLDLDLSLSEGLQESIQRKESVKIEGAKVVDVEFNYTKLSLVLDTDQDGEKLLKLNLDLTELLDEAGLLKN